MQNVYGSLMVDWYLMTNRNPELGENLNPRDVYISHHQAFDKSVRHHLFMSKQKQSAQEANPGPSDHESHTQSVSPPSQDRHKCLTIPKLWYMYPSIQLCVDTIIQPNLNQLSFVQ